MLGFLAMRLLVAVPTLIIISILVFSLQMLLPGDAALVIAGGEATAETIARIRAEHGLDDPLPVQYLRWITNALQGDFGISYRTREEIGPMLISKIPVTLTLATAALAISLLIGIPAGIMAAIWRGRGWDHLVTIVSLIGISVPNFWLGIMMILLFAVTLGWLPAGGYVSPFVDPVAGLKSIIMPATVLGTALAAAMMRHTRSAMLTVLQQDYIRTARAKGLVERIVITKHALRNAMVPIITLATLQFGTLMAGAVLTEQVFSIPGVGKMVVDAVFNREYSAVQAVTLLSGFVFVMLNLLADVLYFWANPKLRSRSL
ncbi:ABC transporter permease subunit [Paracoccus sp. S-4012]|uniref:ABC transporter permease n=1 Tax=Paracoccus sp. S-4012 TaxID=2665648 RepID=UPI0012B012A0|nr:ABC transporter permease [Paracoccus sp. S-4012]MRX51637.1 ABC transporter permease subunit [Paracoccus sp. S-4012]